MSLELKASSEVWFSTPVPTWAFCLPQPNPGLDRALRWNCSHLLQCELPTEGQNSELKIRKSWCYMIKNYKHDFKTKLTQLMKMEKWKGLCPKPQTTAPLKAILVFVLSCRQLNDSWCKFCIAKVSLFPKPNKNICAFFSFLAIHYSSCTYTSLRKYMHDVIWIYEREMLGFSFFPILPSYQNSYYRKLRFPYTSTLWPLNKHIHCSQLWQLRKAQYVTAAFV